jgi:hypothetical protein
LPRPLTPKQEAFAHKYVECGNAAESYRFAYPTSQKWPVTSLYPRASEMLANSKVSARIEALQERSLARVDVTADDIARVAWEIATDSAQQPGPRVSALSLLAKRHHEFSDKHDVKLDQRTQVAQVVANMTQDEMREYIARTLGAGNAS